MLNVEQISKLIEPVLYRAVAHQTNPGLRLMDQWAEFILEKLEVAPCLRDTARGHTPLQYSLHRCKWIDEQLLVFLDAHPDAMVIELFAGLSTRFHRLSHASDWPRFSWVAVDHFDVAECIGYVFPKLDHYSRIACATDERNWLGRVVWLPGRPVVIVCGDDVAPMAMPELSATLHQLVQKAAGTNAALHVVVTHDMDDLQQQLTLEGLPYRVVAEFEPPVARPLFQRFRQAFPGLLAAKDRLKVAHLELLVRPKTEKSDEA